MSASPRRRLRTHTHVAAAAVLLLLFTGVQGAAAGPHRVRLVGTYRAMAVDGIGWGRTDHYLVAGDETYLMQRGGDFPPLASGSRVEVDGTLDGAKLEAASVELAPGARVAAAAPTATPRLATDTRKVLAILVNWTTPDSVTPASAVHQLEAVNDTWYDDASYGQVRMTAQATNWLRIPAPAGCDSGGIMSNALGAAGDAGWNLNAYDHLLVYFPYDATCGYAGMAYVGWGRLWINGYMDTRVTVHEIGHNLGLYHAHSVACTQSGTAVAWSTTCSRSEYGDPADAMGNGFAGVGRFNASQADELGWLQGREKDAKPAGGTYEIAPLGRQRAGLQALRLPGTTHDVWIEYRRATGIDSWLGAGITGGVLVHVPADVGGSDVLDMTPGDANLSNAALTPGATWVDPATDWAIHVVAVRPSRATVTVGKVPDTTAPTFTSQPHLSFASPQQLPRTGKPVRVRVRWAAKDPGGSHTGYDVRMATDGGAFTTLSTDRRAASWNIEAAPGHTYAVQVRAADGWGNRSDWTEAPRISLGVLGEGRLDYHGRWSARPDRRALGHTYRVTTRAGASATLHVRASAVAVLGRMGPAYGSVRVFVDGHRARSFSQRAGGNDDRRVTFRVTLGHGAHGGTHTLRFVNVGARRHPSFSIDGIAVLR